MMKNMIWVYENKVM